jgi:hypothetical protein
VGELLERDDDLGALSAAVDEAAGGRGRVVLVGGEAGIGKTSLLRSLRERIDSAVTFLIGACEPLSVPVPLGPWREIVEAATGRDLADAGTDDRIVLAREVAKALEQRAPVMAAIEDVHWADPLTLDLLRLLARRVEQMHAAIVVTFREDEVASNTALGLAETMHTMANAWLDIAREPEVRQLMLLDAPSVIGWTEYREMSQQNSVARAEQLLNAAIEAGQLKPQPLRPLALVLLGALAEAAMYLARAENPDQAREEARAVVRDLIDGLLRPSPSAGADG